MGMMIPKLTGPRFYIPIAAILSLIGVCRADIALRQGVAGHFAEVNEGVRILTARDDFIVRLSAFDRSARMKTDKPVSEEEFLEFIKANVSAWTGAEKRTIKSAIDRIRPGLRALALSFPKVIYFVKTTGGEEGKAFYTRDTAIVIPSEQLSSNSEALEKAIGHELFHILSRENPELREKLYAAIGFTKCPEIEFPAQLKSRKITNPDAPRNDHFIRLQAYSGEILAVPILFSSAEKYDVSRGGEFFRYLQFKFLVLEKTGGSSFKTAVEDGQPRLLALEQVSGFFEQVGRNTEYVIHPEEILADNFALLVRGDHAASPEIVQKMKQVLDQK
jgi:hypothetical protein